MRLTGSIGVAAATLQIVNIGPFRRRQRPPRSIEVHLLDDGVAGVGSVTVQAVMVDHRATTQADLDGGEQMTGAGVAIATGDATMAPTSVQLPVETLRRPGSFIAIGVTSVAGGITGFVGVNLV